MKLYCTPELQVLQFEQDVVRTSGVGEGGGGAQAVSYGENFGIDTLGF